VSRAFPLLLILVMLAGIVFACAGASGDDDDDDNTAPAGDDDDDDNNDDDDNDNDDDDDDNDTAPQEPLFERGLILPRDSLECTPLDTGIPQLNCNHHASTIAELPDGTIAAVWYHGVAEKSPDSRLVWSTLGSGETAWSTPEVLYDDPERSDGNAALWVHEDGRLFVFFATLFGEGWNDAKLRLITSGNGGATWAAPVFLREQTCWNLRHRPARLANGELLLPLYNECLAYPVFMRSADDGATWAEEAHPDPTFYLQHAGQIQPALIVLDNGDVAAITRDGLPTHRIKRMVSNDHGHTWSPSVSLALPNSGTGIDQARLAGGDTVVVFNNDPLLRFPLSAALSHDDGQTFAAIADLNDECDLPACDYSYPSVLQHSDGTIWVSYSVDRQTIGWVHFNRAWLAQGNKEPNLAR
jgi:predicted neuraminidase